MSNLVIGLIVYSIIVLASYHLQDSSYKKQGVSVQFLPLLGLSLTFPLQVVLVLYQYALRIFGVHLVVNAMMKVEDIESQNNGDE